ncbi:microtubule-actin cross-linking factor 1, isoforms 6/7-like [Podargus strigoides]
MGGSQLEPGLAGAPLAVPRELGRGRGWRQTLGTGPGHPDCQSPRSRPSPARPLQLPRPQALPLSHSPRLPHGGHGLGDSVILLHPQATALLGEILHPSGDVVDAVNVCISGGRIPRQDRAERLAHELPLVFVFRNTASFPLSLFQKEQVDPLQLKLQQVNRVGQGLIQSVGKNCDVQGLGHDMEEINTCWDTDHKKVAQRVAQLQEALLHCEKLQDTLVPLLSWLADIEELISTQKPPSVEYRVVKAQIQKQKCYMQTIKEEMDGLREELEIVLLLGTYLILPSDETEKPEVKSTDEVKNTWENLNKTWKKKLEKLEEAVQLAVQYQDTLRAMLDRLDNAVIEQCNMSPLSTDLSTAKEQMNKAKFHKAWKELLDWLEDAENQLDSELEISNDPDYIELQLSKHKEFQKTLGGKQPVYDTTIRMGRALKEKALLPDDTPKLDNFLGEVQEKWDTVCRKSEERQHKLEEALLFSGQFLDELHALLDWLHKVEPQLDEDQPVHGDLDLVMNLMDAHKVFQKELGKRTATVQMLKRSGQELIENSQGDTTWVKVQLQEVINRWDRVCKLSMSKQARLEKALKQAEQFGTAVHMLLEWLSEAEQSLCFQGAVPDDAKALQSLIDSHKEFMKKVEEKREDVNVVVGMGKVILATCHPDCITTIKHWITTILDRFEKILTWVKQHHQRLESVLSELVANAQLLEEPLAWIQLAESTLLQRDQEPMPQNTRQVKALIAEHQSFMEEMIWKQTDVYRVTKTNKWKSTEPPSGPFIKKSRSNRKPLNRTALPSMPIISQSEMKNPQRNQLSARWEQLWRLVLAREQKLNDALQRLEKILKNQSVIPPATLGAVQAAGPAAAGEVTPPILTSWKHSQRAQMLPGAAWPAGRAARARGRRNPPKSQS